VTYDSGTNIAQNWIEISPAGANIFAIEDNTLSSSIKVLGSGDTIYIEGNFADYQFKQNGKTVTLDNGIARAAITLSSMSNKVQVTTTLVFLDGSVTLTNGARSTKVSINGFNDDNVAKSQLLTTKYADVKINADDSNTTAATYFADLPVNETTTYNLTTNIDSFTPSSNAIVNGILGGLAPTINTFDSVVASGANNTFNVVDYSTTGFAMPASITLSGLQIVNLTRSATTTGNVTITNTTFGTAVTSLNLVDANTTSSGTVAITLNSATSVSAINTGTAGFTSVTITDGGASVLKTVTVGGAVGTVGITGNGITTVNLTAVGGLTTVTALAGTRALTVNVAGATGAGLTDATATNVTINSTVTAAGAVGTYTTAAATTVNFNTITATGATTIAAAVATTLNVGGSALATLTLSGATTALRTINVSGTAGLAVDLTTGAAAGTAVTALNFTNTAGISTVTVNLATAVTGGAGVENITVGAGTAAINLGTGNDTLTLTGAALGTGGTANGGTAGTDVLSMVTANAATASATTAFATAVTGFERLTLTTNAASIIDLAQLGGYNYVTIADGTLALQLNNMASGGTVVIGGANAGGLTMGGSLGSGVNDTLNLALNNSTAALVAFGSVTASNVENIAVVVSDTQAIADPLVNTLNTLTIVDTALRSLTVSGTDGLAITAATTALQTFDASGITSGLATGNTANLGVTYTASALQYASTVKGTLLGGDTLNFGAALASVSITETAGTNTITGSSTIGSTLIGGTGFDTIVGGAGIDTISVGASAAAIINSVTGGAAADSITLTGSVGIDTVIYGANSTAAGAAGINMDTIANFATTVDKIQLTAGVNAASSLGFTIVSGNTLAAMATVINDAVSVATVTDVYTQLASDLVASNLAASSSAVGGLVAREVTFASGAAAGTYLVINDNVAGFQAGSDMVIHLTGTTTFVAGDLAVV
jgi:S-layer protein